MLDRLMGGTILAEEDRIVGEDPDARRLHQRRQANGRPHVVGEHQERRPVGAEPAVDGHAVDDRRHPVLPDSEVDVAPRPIVPAE